MNATINHEDFKLVAVAYTKNGEKVINFINTGGFRHACRVFNEKNITICIKFENYSVFHITFGEIRFKLIIDSVINNPTVDRSDTYDRMITPESLNDVLFKTVAGEQATLESGDVIVCWKKKVYYKNGDNYYCGLVNEDSIVLKDSIVSREEICHATGVLNEF